MATGAVAGLVLGGALVAAAAVPLSSGAPTLRLHLASASATGPTPTLPFPSQGESAVEIPTLKFKKHTKDQRPQPIASLTKLMTAYVALHTMALAPTASGPSIDVGPGDVDVYREDIATNQSSVKVAAGEVLTERQVLEGMLVHSANNFAVLLAEMVAGSTSAMVSDMNATAARLGLGSTTYADVSGFDPASESSAVDQLHLAALLMRDPTFAKIVRLTQVWLPVAGVVQSYTPGIVSLPGFPSQRGVVGTKSGVTSEAGGCDVMAYDARVGAHEVQVLAVVLGQFSQTPGRSNLAAAGHSAFALVRGTVEHLRAWKVALARHEVGTLGWGAQTVPVLAYSTVNVPVFTSIDGTATVRDETWPASRVASGRALARLFVTSGAYREVTDLVTGATLTRASLWQRLR
jgi:D-alanyl-D-alanine carboxypeptidase (penicillin-binding protein 5/6)